LKRAVGKEKSAGLTVGEKKERGGRKRERVISNFGEPGGGPEGKGRVRRQIVYRFG